MFAWLVQIIRGPDNQSKFQMFTQFLAAMLVSLGGTPASGSILGSVNLCKIFRQIFEDRENVRT